MLLFGLLLLLFLQIIRPQDFVPGLHGLRLVLYLMVTLLIGLLFSPVEKKLVRSPQDRYAGLFFLAIVLSSFSIFWIPYIVDTAIETAKIALVYYVIVMISNTVKAFITIVWTMVILMGFVALLGVLQYHGYDVSGAGMVFDTAKGIWRIRGIGNFDNPNDLAYSVVFVVPFSLGFLIQTKGFIGRLFLLILLGIAIYCIYLTRSRGGQVAVVASLASWIYLWINNQKRKRQLIFFLIAATLAVVVVQSTGYRDDESAMGRVEAWAEGWQLLKANPILGVGKDQFMEYHKLDSHSSYIRAGAELGLLGLYTYIGMIYSVFLTILTLQKPYVDNKWRPYYAGFGSFFVSYALASVFSTRTYDTVFLTCVALVGAMGRLALVNTDVVTTEGILFPTETAQLWDRNIFGVTIAVLIAWYLFLRQTW